RWRTRLSVLAAGMFSLIGLVGALRIDGVSGDIVPRLAWRWGLKPDERLHKPTTVSADEGADAKIDLTATTADDFPQFLGRNRDGRISAPRLGRDWLSHPPLRLWRQPIGAGWSSFAVVGHYAVTQEQRGELELIVCYDLLTGKIRWSHADKGRFGTEIDGIGPRATPTIVDGYVYTVGAAGRLNCLNGAGGMVVWTHDVLAEHSAKNAGWGKSCSPAVFGDLVVVSAGGPDGHSLVAYHKQTGERVWEAGDDPSSYSSPVLATLAGVPQVLIVNPRNVVAHDPLDGHLLWRFKWEGNDPKVPQPVPVDRDRVLIAAGYGVGCAMLGIEHGEDDAWEVREIWKQNRLKPKFTNLVVRDGYVYGIDDGRALVCLDTADGQLKWKGGRYGHGQVLLVDDVLLIQAESGEVALVEATPERHHEWTRFQAIEGNTWNNPVLAGRYLLVRNAEEAACYELPLEE
ncbi:MAG TPA: PQQ-binding-like beta-propeller repeat protein, partial [Pirellulales bacterium]|nr:PQQ-binding-like beta-propeller repeat protein [Pirellulales bacterium]